MNGEVREFSFKNFSEYFPSYSSDFIEKKRKKEKNVGGNLLFFSNNIAIKATRTPTIIIIYFMFVYDM